MRIMDYLQSSNDESIVLGLRILGINEDLITEFEAKSPMNYLLIHWFFKRVDGFTIYVDTDYDIVILKNN